MDVFSIFYKNNCMMSTPKNCLDETILMSTYSIHFQNKIRKNLSICFLELSEEFPRDLKMSLNKPRLTSHQCCH